MAIRKIDRLDRDFYALMGPVFGSRRVERETHDRFYDDPGKTWYVGKNCAASVAGSTIKNFWALDEEEAEELLNAMLAQTEGLAGIVPNTFREAFEAAGMRVTPFKKNFIEVAYEKH